MRACRGAELPPLCKSVHPWAGTWGWDPAAHGQFWPPTPRPGLDTPRHLGSGAWPRAVLGPAGQERAWDGRVGGERGSRRAVCLSR